MSFLARREKNKRMPFFIIAHDFKPTQLALALYNYIINSRKYRIDQFLAMLSAAVLPYTTHSSKLDPPNLLAP